MLKALATYPTGLLTVVDDGSGNAINIGSALLQVPSAVAVTSVTIGTTTDSTGYTGTLSGFLTYLNTTLKAANHFYGTFTLSGPSAAAPTSIWYSNPENYLTGSISWARGFTDGFDSGFQ